MLGLVIGFWILRFVLDVDINRSLQILFSPLMTGLNTLPGILTFTFFCTLFWSIGINGDNTLDAVVGPIFLAYLAGNVEAAQANEPLPYITALGFITSFVNVGGTGATIALALVMFFSRAWLPANQSYFHAHPDLPDQRTHHVRFSHRAQPGVHGSFVISAMSLTAGLLILMDLGWIHRPVIHVPWTTPPIIGHFWFPVAIGVRHFGVWFPSSWRWGSIILSQRLRKDSECHPRSPSRLRSLPLNSTELRVTFSLAQ